MRDALTLECGIERARSIIPKMVTEGDRPPRSSRCSRRLEVSTALTFLFFFISITFFASKFFQMGGVPKIGAGASQLLPVRRNFAKNRNGTRLLARGRSPLRFLPKRFKQRGIGGRSENFEHSETFGPMRGPCGAPAREVHTLALFFLPKITTTGVHNAPPQKVLGPKAIAPPEHSSERTSARGHFFDGAPTLLGISAPF